MKDKYFFMHIVKTAGTSLYAMFRSVLGCENVRLVEDPVNFSSLQAQQLNKSVLIGGHFNEWQRRQYFKDRYSIVFLRDPVDRFLSQYYYHRKAQVYAAKVLDLHDYVEFHKDMRCNPVVNVHVFFLAGHVNTAADSADNAIPAQDLLQRAKKNLSQISFTGIYEYLQDSVDLLCHDCGWPPAGKVPRENINPSRPAAHEISGEILDRIRDLNKLDMELYQYGLKLFEQKKRKLLRQ